MYRENKLKCQQIIDCYLITCNTSYHLNSNMSWNCINKILELLNVYIYPVLSITDLYLLNVDTRNLLRTPTYPCSMQLKSGKSKDQ